MIWKSGNMARVKFDVGRFAIWLVLLWGSTLVVERTQGATVFGPPVNLGGAFIGQAPDISADGLTLYYSGGTGATSDILMATRASTASAWSAPVSIGAAVNGSGYNDVAPTISSNGLEMYFYSSDRPGGFSGSADIFVTTRASTASAWGTPAYVSALSTSLGEFGPELSGNGLTIYFASNRTGTVGSGNDLWQATRASLASAWGPVTSLGATVNSTVTDSGPSISSDGLTLYFQSQRAGGLGGNDLYKTTRASTASAWGAPVNLGAPFNSADAETSASISFDGTELYFGSSRPRGAGEGDLYVATAIPEPGRPVLLVLGAAAGLLRRRRIGNR